MERIIETTEHEVEIREKRYILHLESNKMAEITLKDMYVVDSEEGYLYRIRTCEIYDKLCSRFSDKLMCDNNEIVPFDKIVKTSLFEEILHKEIIKVAKVNIYKKIPRLFRKDKEVLSRTKYYVDKT
jgi:hypothetical protein